MIKTRVAIVIPGLGFGGAETMVTQLVKQINKEKFDVYFITTHSLTQKGIKEMFDKINDIHVFSLESNDGISLKTIHRMSKLLKKISPDVIHSHLHIYPYIFPYVLFHKVKVLHTMHNMPIYESNKLGKLILKIMFKLRKAIPVGISNIITQQTKDLYKIKNVETIYNFVDLNRFDYTHQKEHDTFTFITVGRMAKQKNQILLLQAFNEFVKKYPRVKLIFVGDGNLKQELMKYVENNHLKDKIFFIGNITNIEDYYKVSDVFVLSSIYEGLPMTVLEAMSCGLPIVSTNVGGVPDVVQDNGILVPSESLEDLLNAMEEIYLNEKKRKYCGMKSVEFSRKFDLKLITEQYENLYLKYSIKRK